MDRHFIVLGVLLNLVLSLSAQAVAADHPRYKVEVSPDVERMHVTACFPGKRPRTLIAQDERARRYLRGIVAQDQSGDRACAENNGRIVLGGLGHSGCVEYAVAIGDAVDGSRRGLALRARNAIVLSPHLFLWYPSADDSDLEVRFELPAGIRVSAPWRRTGGTKRAPIYRTGSRPASWDARIAIGTFRTERILLPGGSLDVALLDGDPPVKARRVLDNGQTEAVLVTHRREGHFGHRATTTHRR